MPDVTLVIRGGTVVGPGGPLRRDVAVAGDVVVALDESIEPSAGVSVLDAAGCVVGPGLVDLHTHLRQPGREEAETIETGARAAALGGYTAVVAMPNTEPPIDSAGVASEVLALGSGCPAEVAVAGAITVGRMGHALAPMGELADLGVSLFTDDGAGVQDGALMRRALDYAKGLGVTLAQHCEDASLAAGGAMHEGCWSSRLGIPGMPAAAEEAMVARDIALVRLTGAPVHFLHLSTAGSVDLVRQAKREGLPVTAEAAPHHMLLTHDLVAGYDPVFKVNPPLRTDDDVDGGRRRPLRRHHRRRRNRPCPARPRVQGRPFRPGAAGHARPANRAAHRVGGPLTAPRRRPRVLPAQLAARGDRAAHGIRSAACRPQRSRRPCRHRCHRQPVRVRPWCGDRGRTGTAGQPEPEHAVRGPDVQRSGTPHRVTRRARRDRCGGPAVSIESLTGTPRARALLVTADGAVFVGEAAGAPLPLATGELVFNTAMSGYQEVITDPSYAGQVISFTSTHIGNYGTNAADDEAPAPHCRGVVVCDLAGEPSNWRSTEALEPFLVRHGVPAMTGVDTRRLARHVRQAGAVPCAFGTAPEAELAAAAAAAAGTDGMDLVSGVTAVEASMHRASDAGVGGDLRIVAFDFGVKTTMVSLLTSLGTVTVVPASTAASDVVALEPDGVFLSNGPGDPAALDGPIDTVADLVGRVPIFGICLGHQILATALGGTTYKLPFGHHGANHPVQRLETGVVEITSQNHNYAVAAGSIPEAETTHVNLNDGVIEGFRSLRAPAFSVQYHPEAAPGPHDARYLFAAFRDLMLAHPTSARSGARAR